MFSLQQFFGKHLLLILLTIALGGAISIAVVPSLRGPVTDYIGDTFGPKADEISNNKDPFAKCDFSNKPADNVPLLTLSTDRAEVGSLVTVSFENNGSTTRSIGFGIPSYLQFVSSNPGVDYGSDGVNHNTIGKCGYEQCILFDRPVDVIKKTDNLGNPMNESWLKKMVYSATFKVIRPSSGWFGLTNYFTYLMGTSYNYKGLYTYYDGLNIEMIPLDSSGKEVPNEPHLFNKSSFNGAMMKSFKIKVTDKNGNKVQDNIKIFANILDAAGDQNLPFYSASINDMPYSIVKTDANGEGKLDFSYRYSANGDGVGKHAFSGTNQSDSTTLTPGYDPWSRAIYFLSKAKYNENFSYKGPIEFIAYSTNDCSRKTTRITYYQTNASQLVFNTEKTTAKADGKDKIKVKIDYKNSDGTINNAQNVEVYSSGGKLSMTGDNDKFAVSSQDSTLSLLGNREFYILDDKSEKVTIYAKSLDQNGKEITAQTDVNFQPLLKPTIQALNYTSIDKNGQENTKSLEGVDLTTIKFKPGSKITFAASFEKITGDYDNTQVILDIPKEMKNLTDQTKTQLSWEYDKLVKDQTPPKEEFTLQIAKADDKDKDGNPLLNFANGQPTIKLQSSISDSNQPDKTKWQKSNELDLSAKQELTLNSHSWETTDESIGVVNYDDWQSLISAAKKNDNIVSSFFGKMFLLKSVLAQASDTGSTTTESTQSNQVNSNYTISPTQNGTYTQEISNDTSTDIKNKTVTLTLPSSFFINPDGSDVSVKQTKPTVADNFAVKDKKVTVNQNYQPVVILTFDNFAAGSNYKIIVNNIKSQVPLSDVSSALNKYKDDFDINIKSTVKNVNSYQTALISFVSDKNNYQVPSDKEFLAMDQSNDSNQSITLDNSNFPNSQSWLDIVKGQGLSLLDKLFPFNIVQAQEANTPTISDLNNSLQKIINDIVASDLTNKQILDEIQLARNMFDTLSNNNSMNFNQDTANYLRSEFNIIATIKKSVTDNVDLTINDIKPFGLPTISGDPIKLPPYTFGVIERNIISGGEYQSAGAANGTVVFNNIAKKNFMLDNSTGKSRLYFNQIPVNYYGSRANRFTIYPVIKIRDNNSLTNLVLDHIYSSTTNNGSNLSSNIFAKANKGLNDNFNQQLVNIQKEGLNIANTSFKAITDGLNTQDSSISSDIKNELSNLDSQKQNNSSISALEVNKSIVKLSNKYLAFTKTTQDQIDAYKNAIDKSTTKIMFIPDNYIYKYDSHLTPSITSYFTDLHDNINKQIAQINKNLAASIDNFNATNVNNFIVDVLNGSFKSLEDPLQITCQVADVESSSINAQSSFGIIKTVLAQDSTSDSTQTDSITINPNNTMLLPSHMDNNKIIFPVYNFGPDKSLSDNLLITFTDQRGNTLSPSVSKESISSNSSLNKYSCDSGGVIPSQQQLLNSMPMVETIFAQLQNEKSNVIYKDSHKETSILPQPQLSITSIVRDGNEQTYSSDSIILIGDQINLKLKNPSNLDLQNIDASINLDSNVKGINGSLTKHLGKLAANGQTDFTLTIGDDFSDNPGTGENPISGFSLTPSLKTSIDNMEYDSRGTSVWLSTDQIPASVSIEPDTIIRKNDKEVEEEFVYLDGADNELYPGDKLNLTINADYIGNNMELKVNLPQGVSMIDGSKEASWTYDEMIGQKTEQLQLKLDDSIPLDTKQLKFKAQLIKKESSGDKNLATSDELAVDLWGKVEGKLSAYGDTLTPIPFVKIQTINDSNEISGVVSTDKNGNFSLNLNRNKSIDNNGKVKFKVTYCNPYYDKCDSNYSQSTNDLLGPNLLFNYVEFKNIGSQEVPKYDSTTSNDTAYFITKPMVADNNSYNVLVRGNPYANDEILEYPTSANLDESWENIYFSKIYSNFNDAWNVATDQLGISFSKDEDPLFVSFYRNDIQNPAYYINGTVYFSYNWLSENINRRDPIEYHEFGHYIWYKKMSISPDNSVESLSHYGYLNPDTNNSLSEGWANFYDLVTRNQKTGKSNSSFTSNYLVDNFAGYLPAFWRMDYGKVADPRNPGNNKFDGQEYFRLLNDQYEEFSVAHLLWILTHGTDLVINNNDPIASIFISKDLLPTQNGFTFPKNHAITLKELANIISENKVMTVKDLYDKIRPFYNSKMVKNSTYDNLISGKWDYLDQLFIGFCGFYNDLNSDFMIANDELNSSNNIVGYSGNSASFYTNIAPDQKISTQKHSVAHEEISALMDTNVFRGLIDSRNNRKYPTSVQNSNIIINTNSSELNDLSINVLYQSPSDTVLNFSYQKTVNSGEKTILLVPPIQKTTTFITLPNSLDYLAIDSDKYQQMIDNNYQNSVLDSIATANFTIQQADPDKGIVATTPPTLEQMQAMEAEKEKAKQAEIDKALAAQKAQEEADKLAAEQAQKEKDLQAQADAQAKADLQAELDKLTQEIADANKRAQEAEEARLKALEDLKIAQEAQLAAQQAQLKAEQDKAAELAKLEADKQAEIVKNQKLVEENAKLEKQLADYQKQIDNLTSKLTKTQEDLAQVRTEKDNILIEKNKLIDDLAQAKEENKVLDQISLNLRQSVLTLEEQLKNLNIAYLVSNESNQQNQLNNLEDKKDLIMLTDTNAEIKNQLKDQISLNNNLTQQNTDLINQIESQNDQIIKDQTTINQLQSNLTATQDNLTKIQTQKLDLEQQNSDLTNQLQKAKDDHNIILQINLTLQKTVSDLQIKLKESQLAQAQREEADRLQAISDQLAKEAQAQKELADLQTQQELKAKELELQSNQTDKQVSVEQDKQTILNNESQNNIDQLDQYIKKVENEKQQITNQINEAISDIPLITIKPIEFTKIDTTNQTIITQSPITTDPVATKNQTQRNDIKIATISDDSTHLSGISSQTITSQSLKTKTNQELIINTDNFKNTDNLTVFLDDKQIVQTPIITPQTDLKITIPETTLGLHTITVKDDLGNQAQEQININQNKVWNTINLGYGIGTVIVLILGLITVKILSGRFGMIS